MNILKREQIKEQTEEYNDIPVLYCKRCLSLKIKAVASMKDSDYCDECGSTDIDSCHIEEWESIYKNKHGHTFLEEY